MGESGNERLLWEPDSDLPRRLEPRMPFKLIGESPAWKEALRLVRRIAETRATVLIEGETGTGKELVARAIHELGSSHDFPFIPLNCGALPDNLLETELFGHERGAFTDARERRIGLVAEARGGTLFLDEVEVMSPRAQVVLLRFLQDQTYIPVGGRALNTADVRIIAASNADLQKQVERFQFRSDLLFRLRVLHVRLPPLRERDGDVRLLAQSFAERLGRMYQKPPLRLSERSLAQLETYRWPGNVRELESFILRELLMHEGGSEEWMLSPTVEGQTSLSPAANCPGDFRSAKAQAIAQFEKSYLEQLLKHVGGNMSLAARLAHKDRGALKKLAKKYGIKAEMFRTGNSESQPPCGI